MFRDDLIMNAQLLLADLEERRLKLATADRTRGAIVLGDELVATGTKSIHHE